MVSRGDIPLNLSSVKKFTHRSGRGSITEPSGCRVQCLIPKLTIVSYHIYALISIILSHLDMFLATLEQEDNLTQYEINRVRIEITVDPCIHCRKPDCMQPLVFRTKFPDKIARKHEKRLKIQLFHNFFSFVFTTL